ncbi:MAG: SprT family zinc-dependent metalloprotease [Gemmatimonadaceae bacterium]|nr:SprT family zinc-dependent metalloprotease [Gemmatimonadaceae bacterium]
MTGTLETSTITWGDTRLTYAIRRSARRKKTVAVTVDPGGGVLLLAPEDFPTSRLDEVVRRKAGWIVRRMRGVGANGVPPSPREFVSGESVMYLGRHYRLKVHPGETGEAKLRGGWLHVPAAAGAEQPDHVRAGLVAWMRSHAAERLPERVELWRSNAGVEMPRVVISDQKRRWGSCDRRGTIRLNWRIIQAPMRLVDYVVVHELVHLRHRGHGSEYWQALGRIMPDYERRREDLRERGGGLAW